MNQQAIDRVKERLSKYLKRTDDSDKSYDNWYCKALEHTLEDLQALWDGWIPVTEDTERNKLYLLYAIEWFYFIWYYDWASNNYCRDWSDWELVIATHYKPLPLPPQINLK